MHGKTQETARAAATRVTRVLPEVPDGWLPTHDDPDPPADDVSAPEEPPTQPVDDHRRPADLDGEWSASPSAGELVRRLLAEWFSFTGARVSPTRRGWQALVAVAVLAAGVSGVVWWRSRAVPTAVPPAVVSSAASTAPGGASSAASAGSPVIVVDVTGKVRDPGVVRLPAGSRVQDAIHAAGGLRHGAHTGRLNLARKLSDGEQVVVGKPPGLAPSAAGGSPQPGAKIDLNTATMEQLEALPGVGPVLGQRIIDFRTKHGGFRTLEQLKDVSGIGDATYADLAPLVQI